MKKFIVFVFLFFSFTFANAQFVGGDTINSSDTKIIASWDNFDKSFVYGDNMYCYIHITKMPKNNLVGTIESAILTISLGKTKEEAISTLNAYYELIDKLGKNDSKILLML